ncbi:MAG: hypothetical protein VKO19_00895 [Cyanobacteriota bacterium]|nr:hypothetical protein [Cyanobacteriota bacterium]
MSLSTFLWLFEAFPGLSAPDSAENVSIDLLERAGSRLQAALAAAGV